MSSEKPYIFVIDKSHDLVGVPRTVAKVAFKDINGNPSWADQCNIRIDNLGVIGVSGLCFLRDRNYLLDTSYIVDEYFTVGTDYYIFLDKSLGDKADHFFAGDTFRTVNSTTVGNDQDYPVLSADYSFGIDEFAIAAGPTYYIHLDAADGDRSADYTAGEGLVVTGAANVANNGNYTIVSASFVGTRTRIVVTEAVSVAETSSTARMVSEATQRTRIKVSLAIVADEAGAALTAGTNCVTDDDYPLRVNETWKTIEGPIAEMQIYPEATADGSKIFVRIHSNRDIRGTTIT